VLEISTLKTSRRHSAWRGAVLERARRPALALRALTFYAAHERAPPTVGRGVADGAEHGVSAGV
jgi:hypothetical protein